MNYGNIKYYDIANGQGVRTTLFVSGCTNHCLDCFQPQTWDFNYGQPFTEETEKQILDSLKPDYIQGFTALGGEPFEFENQRGLVSLFKHIKETYPDKTIWCYGFLYALLPTAIGYIFYFVGLSGVKESSKVPVVASVENVVAVMIGVYHEQRKPHRHTRRHCRKRHLRLQFYVFPHRAGHCHAFRDADVPLHPGLCAAGADRAVVGALSQTRCTAGRTGGLAALQFEGKAAHAAAADGYRAAGGLLSVRKLRHQPE